MKAIWKFPLEAESRQEVWMPTSAQILSIQSQQGVPCIWALVNPDLPTVPRTIVKYPTGTFEKEITGTFLGTCQFMSGNLVFHFFEEENENSNM